MKVFTCKFCNKECKNKNSLAQHKIRCVLNPDKLEIPNNFIKYNEDIKSGKRIKSNTNQFTKAKNEGKIIKVSKETRKKISDKSKAIRWTDNQKANHSKIMIATTIKYPDSYSANNVCGRSKLIEIIDSYGNQTKVNGGWEKLVAEYLHENKIKWTNKITENIQYFWNGQMRRYYPDFYLPEYNLYVEVKGYERERDRQKWNVIKDKLIIIKFREIEMIKNKTFKMLD